MAPDIDAAASKSRADAEVDRPDRRARHAVVVACAVVAAAAASRYRRGPRVFTKTELAAYDGADEKKPIYLAIMGQVFDVAARAVPKRHDPNATTQTSRPKRHGAFKTHGTVFRGGSRRRRGA